MNGKSNVIFIIMFLLIIYGGFIFGILSTKDNNWYENRVAYKVKDYIGLKDIFSTDSHDNLESALADQIPFSDYMKKGYNYLNNNLTMKGTELLVNKKCDNNYIHYTDKILIFGCGNNLVYEPEYYSDSSELFDSRVNDINLTIENSPVPIYIYYIEKDTDIDFTDKRGTEIFDILKSKINSKNMHVFEINNFNEFKDYFYETDHHWNYKGSYKSYLELSSILGNKDIIKHNGVSCSPLDFSGSKARVSGATHIFKEKFCVYNFKLPKHKVYINGKEVESYGLNSIDGITEISYELYYGSNKAEIIFDYNNPDKENILIIGESYDNAILNLLSTHYNKTFSIDLRDYERVFGKPFDYKKYIDDNDIDKILLIGNIDFYRMSEFNLEGNYAV